MPNAKKIMSGKEKEGLIRKISEIIGSKGHILFAYVFGSFSTGERFRDIDVGIYVSDAARFATIDAELALETELEEACRVPVDVRIMNRAPVTFAYHILKSGRLLVDKDPSRRCDYEGLTYKEYFDVRHLRREYLREIVHAPV